MPSTRPKLCHIDHIKRVCLLCFGKTKRMLPLTDDLRQIIDTNFVCGINATDDRLPTSICKTCYNAVSDARKGLFKRQISLFDYSVLQDRLKPITRSGSDCNCIVCNISKSSIPSRSDFKLTKDTPTVGRPHLETVIDNCKPTVVKLCTVCLSVIGKGKTHACSPLTRNENLLPIINEN